MSSPRRDQRRLLTERARRARDVVRLADVDNRRHTIHAHTAPSTEDVDATVRRAPDGLLEFGPPIPKVSPFPAELSALVPNDGEWHHLTASRGKVYLDGHEVNARNPQEGPHPVNIDTRPLVVVRLQEVTLGSVSGWRAVCSACPGFAPGVSKANARAKAAAHVQEHDTAGHRVELHEPSGGTKPRPRRKGKR